ncbi:MAG: cyclic nucleotide-binding domain-containing protein, partial [Myxococcota bacterium]
RTYVTDESSLTALFGVLHAVVGVGALAVQAFGTGPLLRRFGVFAFLSCIPVLCLGLSALLWWQPQVFALIFALKAFEMMGSLSLNQPAIGILYNPMPLGMRDAVRAVIDGAIKKFGGAVGGGLLLVVGAQKPAIGLVGVLAALLIWRIYRLRPRYWAALSAKLAASEVPALLSIDPSDRATRQKLLTALDADDVQTVLRALDILARHPGSELPLYLIRLLTHARSVVRRRAIALIREAPQQRYAPYLEKIIGAGGAQPKGPAAEALVAVDRSTALRVLTPYLDARTMAQDPDLACIAIWVALDADDPNVVARAHRRLAAMVELSGAPVVRRRAVAALLGRLGAGPTAAALAPLLDDEDAAVRQAAVKSAASTRHSSLMRGLIVRLGDPPLWRDAAAALCAYGDDAASMLAQTLVDDAMPMHVRLKVPFVLQRIGSDTAAQALLLLGVEQGVQLRFEAMQALFRLRGGRPALVVDPGQIERGVHRCLEDYGRFEGIATDLAAGGPAFALVARAVAARQKQSVLAAVMLLGLIVDYEAIERSVAGIRAGLMPDALELLDATLRGTGLRKAVLAGLEPRPHTAQPGAATSRAAALIDGDDRLVAELAHRTLRRIGGHAARAAGKRPMLRAESKSSGLPEATIDRLFVLEGVPLFQGLSVDVLVKVASIMEQGWTKPHEAVYQQGEPGDAMFVVIAGEIRLFKDDTPLLDLGVGEAFGQVSLLDRGLRPVSARAQEEGVEYLILKRRPLMQLLADEPSLMNGMFIELARRLRELVALSVPSDGSTRPMPPIPPTVTGPTIHLPLTVRSSTIGRS